ncbi:MAG: RNA polymerase sigma factor [Bacteroidaceae bacterium]|nr:RNA polymerase sigma factor [Bacteroidaceae bacterium]
MKIQEDELIKALQHPSTRRQAFEQVVRDHSQDLYSLIRRMVLDHDDADDILQDVFVKAWLSLPSFRGESKVSSWLYRIAYNECLQFLQKKKNQVSLDSTEGTIANQLMADQYFDGDEMEAKFQEAIQTLPDKQRMVFCMKYFQEMKYEDISSACGTTVGALKASYHLAVKRIEDFFNSKD